jgi:hypothetical protein
VDDIIDIIFSPRWRGGVDPTAHQANETETAATATTGGDVSTVTGNDNNNNEHLLPRRFPQNVPLPQMVDVLVDLWEAEGLDT